MGLPENLKKIRKEHGLSQMQLAQLIGASQTSVHQWENGDRKPKIESLQKICELFNVEVEEITGEKPASSEPTLTERLIQVAPEVIKNLKNEHTESDGESYHTHSSNIKGFGSVIDQVGSVSKLLDSMGAQSKIINKTGLSGMDSVTKLIDSMGAQFDRIDSIGRATRLSIENYRSIQLAALIECYDDLTPEGQQVLLSVADALTYSPKYGKPEEETREEPEENTDNQKEKPGE